METTTDNNKRNIAMPPVLAAAKDKFEIACRSAEGLQMINNFGAAFQAVTVVSMLREALTDEVMDKVFMPLQNTKIGFLTDHTGKARGSKPALLPYSRDIVRDAIIDAVTIGLLPTGNQFNIISERMYPTKEGYTALLRRLGVKYFIEIGPDKSQAPDSAELTCKISYLYAGEKNTMTLTATVKKDQYSSYDQLRGKAERRAKKALYEYITGCDFGDADEDSSTPQVVDVVAEEISTKANQGGTIGVAPQPTPTARPVTPTPQPQRPTAQAAPQRPQPTMPKMDF
jgi:hypothetical protein